ncbi:hypothetical protein CPB84DRAFT_1776452 [Gymnopilus junonius]|uniref:Kynurenine formamidase n=1 Tax=Gymnopilus junonius TaxID=109634 RepID=A0A9P5TMZ9_GYMJU|nr:hypothetical protein CPB84DRAFT_1776452 [Gymnopilus junonius]
MTMQNIGYMPSDDALRQLDVYWPEQSSRSTPGPLICFVHGGAWRSSVTPSLTPAQALIDSVKGIILSEGIYDIDTLLASFPSYRDWFIQPTFGPSESYAKFSVLGYPLRSPSNIYWLLLHSKGDTLVDLPQTEAMHNYLLHIYPERVSINTDDLTDEHNAILRTDIYVKIVSNFIAKFIL